MTATSYPKAEGLKPQVSIYVSLCGSESQESEMEIRGLKSEL